MRPFLLVFALALWATRAAFSQQVSVPKEDSWSRSIASGNSDTVAAFVAANAPSSTLLKQGQALRLAIKLHDEPMIQWLLQRNPTLPQKKLLVNSHDAIGRTPLFVAVKTGQLAVAKALIEAGADLNTRTQTANYSDEGDALQTPLDIAFNAENVAMLRLLIEAGADLKITLRAGFQEPQSSAFSALLSAAAAGHNTAFIEFLLARRQGYQLSSGFWGEVASYADLASIKLLIGAYSPRATPAALVEGAERSKRPNLLRFLKLPVPTPARGTTETFRSNAQQHITPLHVAALNGDLEAVQALLKKGADVEAVSIAGETPLHFAAWGAHPRIIAALLAAGASPHRVNGRGETPLHLAAKITPPDQWASLSSFPIEDQAASVTLLLSAGANPNAANDHGETALILALKPPFGTVPYHDADAVAPHALERGAVVKALLQGKADPDGKGVVETPTEASDPTKKKRDLEMEVQPSPLHLATGNGDVVIVKALLAAGADPAVEDESGRTCDDWALRRGENSLRRYDYPFANWIVSRSNQWEEERPRLFDTAPQRQILALLWATRKAPAPRLPNAPVSTAPITEGRVGSGPFFQAIAYGATTWVKETATRQSDLIQARASFSGYNDPTTYHAPEEGAWTAPLVALWRDHLDLSLWLVEHGAPIDRRGTNPESLVVLSSQKHAWRLLDALLKRGASILEADASGETALHVATATDDVEAIEELLRRGADVNAPSRYRETPLRRAIQQGSTRATELLRAHGGLEKLPVAAKLN